ncbi:Cytidine deaminase [Spironucleus salmonicida]|uniref:Cytidine deaminase n=1 Tax=Spironucleus salmonicida TaxID=348837 RepID=V6LGR8_9EUKA|nr:Cytidine deaminase [Spironucleus salmonicida]|eukprot:EST42901.1 Cytidine deaminase [Spironucleus salmonicida]
MQITQQQRTELIAAALEGQKMAYCPYSNYPVGAAVLSDTGVIVKGCNVENAAYPNGACAEKTAIGTAVAQGHRNIVAVAIVTRDSGLPCGSCRQVLNEFGADMWCIMLNGAGEVTMEMPLTQVLPHAFGPKNLL